MCASINAAKGDTDEDAHEKKEVLSDLKDPGKGYHLVSDVPSLRKKTSDFFISVGDLLGSSTVRLVTQ